MSSKKTPKPITVRMVYRNYRPIHKIYQSIINNPPAGVTYKVPKVNKRLRLLFPFYRKLRYFTLGRLAISFVEKTFFLRKNNSQADLYHYICMIDSSPPDMPYVVDVEHAASLLSFTYNLAGLNKVKDFLKNPNCKFINCQSKAANRTLQGMLGDDYEAIESKINVVYPSLSLPSKDLKADYRYIKNDPKKLKMLLIGNRAYLKGVEELVAAIKQINQKYSDEKLELHVISDDAQEIIDAYRLPNVILYQPKFNEQELVTQFYKPADVLISPTKQDTYGMTLIEALSCGTPVIATNQFAIPELINNGVDGILLQTKKALLDDAVIPAREDIVAIHHSNLDSAMVDQLISIISDILDGKFDLHKLRNKGLKKFQKGGQLYSGTRNDQLLEIYHKALGLN